MTRLSHLLFVIHVNTVIFFFQLHTNIFGYSLLFLYIYQFSDTSYITYIQHTGYLFLDAINSLHAATGPK